MRKSESPLFPILFYIPDSIAIPAAPPLRAKSNVAGRRIYRASSVKELKQLLGRSLGSDFLHHVSHHSGIVTHKSGAHNSHVFTSRHFLQLPYAGQLAELSVGVGHKRERQTLFLGKLLMARLRIFAHANHLIPHLQKCVVVFTKADCLGSAAGGIVFRIEIDDKVHSRIGRESHFISVAVCPEKIGHFVANIHSGNLKKKWLYTKTIEPDSPVGSANPVHI